MRDCVKVLFVCIGNSCRSQMAEALAKHTAADVIVAKSAGTHALGQIAEPTLVALNLRNVDTEGQTSKAVTQELLNWADVVVNMTGMSARQVLAGVADKTEDWDVMDPFGHAQEIHDVTCDEIEARVGDLARRLRKQLAEEKARLQQR